ncbi:endo alpha-1,4 polygalactosaminidase [Methylobacterium planeticum]|uniref:Glycoside-hydrolase family GH114 TIM-barrel domain-containing protein n=1 Tax=Methylobacterium planeticum TaxID=2615211 RepID=A0A6N6MNQ3_9HYPH|nr:endo alpha-1,4 polygalactosaminidase [Methylobacterium planeticum]KAB1070741.1 hypothetical protein F6X51_21445 [Methylobacterium planeticum]
MPKTGLYLLQGISPDQVATSPFDVRVIDAYDENGSLWTSQQVAKMGGGSADPHLLLGYFSIGEAETYRDYYDTIPKAAIGPENPQWEGNFEVAFWTSEWKAVATQYVDNLIKAGYDGAYFDVVDEYQTKWAQSQIADPAKAMADLVKSLADYAHAQNPNFKIWVNNAEELLQNDTYFNAVDGMFKENLYYNDNGEKQSAGETKSSLEFLNKMVAAGKDVIAIEYVSGSDKIADVHAQADRDGLGSYVAHLDLDGIDYDGVRAGQDSGAGTVTPPAEPVETGGGGTTDAAAGGAQPAPSAPDKESPAQTPGPSTGSAPETSADPDTDAQAGGNAGGHAGHHAGGHHDSFHFHAGLSDGTAHAHHQGGAWHGAGHGGGHDGVETDPMSLYLQHSCGSDHAAHAG